MARIPDPVPGLIVRYGYLWVEDFRNNRTSPSKDRPACIVARVGDVAPSLRTEDRAPLAPDDVILMPITTRPPPASAFVVELAPAEKRLCRLDPEVPSWLIVSEFNADIWPNADLSLVPGGDRFAYGMAPPGLLRRIGQRFAEARRAGVVRGIKR